MTSQIRERALALVAGGALIFAISASVLPSVNASHLAPVGLGTATSFAILAGTGVTSVPTSTINGNLGVSPTAGASIVVSCAEMGGTIYAVDATGPACAIIDPGLLTSAKNSLTGAISDAAGRTGGLPVAANELGGKTLTHGVYSSGSTMALSSGTLTLDAGGDPSAVWIFQLGSDLTVGNATSVSLTNGAQACNVFWKVNSAFIGSTATFVGNVLASTQITVANDTTITGRLLASTANVTLINDTINLSTCAVPQLIPPTRPPFTVAPSATAVPTPTPVGPTATPAGTPVSSSATPVSSTATPSSATAAPVAAVAATTTPGAGGTPRPLSGLPSTSTDLEAVPTWALVLVLGGFGLIVVAARMRSRMRPANAPTSMDREM